MIIEHLKTKKSIFTAVEWYVLCMSFSLYWLIMLLNSADLYPTVLSLAERGMLKSPTIVVSLSIFHFISYCFIHSESLVYAR
jgi:hypothetical protein